MKRWKLIAAPLLVIAIIGSPLASDRAGDASVTDETTEGAQAEQNLGFDAAFNLGRTGYASNCSSCHGSAGQGDMGPSLIGNDLLADTDLVLDTIINGFSYMPPFGDTLNDAQIAGISTFIKNSWGNEYGYVSADEVADNR